MFSDNLNIPFDLTQERNFNLRVTPIKVMLNTNIPNMKPFPLQFSTLYHHDLEKGRFSANQYTYPYFTNSVQYPMSILASKTYSDRIDFFFNKNRFTKICRKSGTDYIDYNDVETDKPISGTPPTDDEIEQMEKENGDFNIRCMLILLLPIADEFTNVFQTSYEQYILDKPSSEIYTIRNIDPTTLLNPTWLPLYNYFSERKYYKPIQEISYLSQNGKKYVVNGVVWLNDLVNHPVYREFLSGYYQKFREKINNRKKIKKQMAERIEIFSKLLAKYNKYPDAKGDNLFKVMIGILLNNVMISIDTDSNTDSVPVNTGTVFPEIEYPFKLKSKINQILSPTEMNKFNNKDQTKRESITKICNYLFDAYTNTKHKVDIVKLSEYDIFQIIDNITSAYNEYSLYNESADKSMLIDLKDTTRIFVELYNSAIFLKSIQLIDMFLDNKITRFDVSEKNEDGTPKPKLELDIIRSVTKNFSYYVQLNDDILNHMKSVVEPTRRSSNYKLQTFLKSLSRPTPSEHQNAAIPTVQLKDEKKPSNNNSDDKFALVDIYNKYITNMRKTVNDSFITNYMDIGISSIVNNDPSAAGLGKECPEVYVYVNVVEKDEYEKSPNRKCIMSDDLIANNLKQLLFSNTMMDSTFPEVNPYRSFQFLKGSELGRNDTSTNGDSEGDSKKSNATNPYLVQPAATGGYTRFTRNRKSSISNTRLGRSRFLTKRKHMCYKQRRKTPKYLCPKDI